MSRVDNWPRALEEHIQNQMHRPFEWGVHDCLLFAASCVEAVSGDDPAIEYRGTYSTALAAYRIIDDAGGFDALIDSCLGVDRVHINLAQRGDVVSRTDEKSRTSAGVCVGAVYVFTGPSGLVFLPKQECNISAWRIK
jgi:hypothetical protein